MTVESDVKEQVSSSMREEEARIPTEDAWRKLSTRLAIPAKGDWQATGPPRVRHSIVRPLLLVAAVLIVGAALFLSSRPESSVLVASPGTSAPATAPAPTATGLPDIYQRVASTIDGPTYFPTVRPPDTAWVNLSSSSEGRELLGIQHRDVSVYLCSMSPCAQGAVHLKDVVLDGQTFSLDVAPNSKLPGASAQLPEDLRAYWSDVQWTSTPPKWLVAGLWPGSARGPYAKS